MAILMCPPRYFDTEYEINPWMHLDVPVDRELAQDQWERLRHAFIDAGETVELVDPQPGLPDMVFTANAGVIHRGRAVISRFRHPERRGEEPVWRRALEALGLEVHVLASAFFEGAGDALFVGDRLFAGHGFRSDRASHAEVGRILDVEVTSIELVDPRFYHLDTCFSPINAETILFAPEAFSPTSAQLIRDSVGNVIEAPPHIAAGFACNALVVGDHIISSTAATQLGAPLRSAGYEVICLPMSEFMKSGGGVRCLSLPLET
jgi:N-dimethylarginine dimethylaminohydrolase